MSNLIKPQTTSSGIKFSFKVILATMLGLALCGIAIAHEADHARIEVHGDWIVTVSNPDGSIAQERSFKNALVTPGLLVGLIYAAAEWTTDIDGSLWLAGPDPMRWFIEVATTGVDTSSCQDYLTVESGNFGITSELAVAMPSAVSNSSFTLTRTLALPLECVTGENYAINGVSTAFAGIVVESGGLFTGHDQFTEKTLPAPITGILPDQVVTLKATISFQ